MIEARDLGLKQDTLKGTIVYYNLGLSCRSNMIVAGVEVESMAPIARATISRGQFAAILRAKFGGRITPEIAANCRFLADGSVDVPIIPKRSV
jgi:hypothetical protein